MEKKYKLPEESNSMLNEPAIEYSLKERYSPPLTEEELADCITGDELREHMRQYIHELFNK